MQMNNKNILVVAAIVAVAAITRLLPHPMNFAPLGAMALFGSAYFGKKGLGLLITMVAWLLSDFILNNFVYSFSSDVVIFTQGAPFIYGSIVLIYLMGTQIMKKTTLVRMLSGSLLASIIFFAISNFGVWVSGTIYPMNATGLVTCYAAAIPFFTNTMAGDLFYAGVLFVLYERVFKSQLLAHKA
jgi:hypothetical protein